MRANLPLPVIVSPPMADVIRRQSPAPDLSKPCRVLSVRYMGDEGGIVCELGRESGGDRSVFHCSPTQPILHPGMLLGREIAAYQKCRAKRLRLSRHAQSFRRRVRSCG